MINILNRSRFLKRTLMKTDIQNFRKHQQIIAGLLFRLYPQYTDRTAAARPYRVDGNRVRTTPAKLRRVFGCAGMLINRYGYPHVLAAVREVLEDNIAGQKTEKLMGILTNKSRELRVDAWEAKAERQKQASMKNIQAVGEILKNMKGIDRIGGMGWRERAYERFFRVSELLKSATGEKKRDLIRERENIVRRLKGIGI